MGTVTVTINTRTKRAQYLLGLAKELAKIDNGVTIVDPVENLEKSIKEMKQGKLKPIDDLLQ